MSASSRPPFLESDTAVTLLNGDTIVLAIRNTEHNRYCAQIDMLSQETSDHAGLYSSTLFFLRINNLERPNPSPVLRLSHHDNFNKAFATMYGELIVYCGRNEIIQNTDYFALCEPFREKAWQEQHVVPQFEKIPGFSALPVVIFPIIASYLTAPPLYPPKHVKTPIAGIDFFALPYPNKPKAGTDFFLTEEKDGQKKSKTCTLL
jgi:hypothetical protein